MNSRLVLALAMALSGCTFGTPIATYTPAHSAAGITVQLRTRVNGAKPSNRSVNGQLLALMDTAFLLIVADLVDGPVVFIAASAVEGGNFEGFGHVSRDVMNSERLDRMRLTSQFPQGMTADLAKRVLDAYHQPELIVWARTGEKRVPRDRVSEIFPSEGRDQEAARDSFVARARAGTERFRDRTQAIREGYRRVGPDFPFMGEHWVHPSLVIDGHLNAQRPAVLSYTLRGGTPLLIGVGYAVAGQAPADFAPGGAHWHDHGGTVADALLTIHGKPDMVGEGEPRFAVLHAWVWTGNPDGLFTTDNTALPFVRAGLTPPTRSERNAASALSLISGGDVFFAEVMIKAAQANASQARAIEQALAVARTRVQEWRLQVADHSAPAEQDQARLAAIWIDLAHGVLSDLDKQAAERVRPHLLSDHHQ